MIQREKNIYDNLIIFFLILQAFGGIGDALQPIRIFIIVLIPWILKFILTHKSVVIGYSYEIHVFFIWIVYALISILWVIEPNESIKEVIYLFVNFTGFILLIFLSNNAMQPKESILKGWVWIFIFTLPVALMELIFDKHLSLAYQSENLLMNFGDGIVLQRRFASVTFGNLNGYNTMLMYITPFLFGSLIKNNDFLKFPKIISLILIVIISIIIGINSSRAAFVGFLIALFVFVLFYIKNIKTLIGSGVVFAAIIGFLFFSNNDFFNLLFTRFDTQGLADENRYILIEEGIRELLESGFMGIGAGDFIPTMEKIKNLNNYSSHNFFLEVLVQYGLIIFVLFIGFFIRIIRKNRHNEKRYTYITTACLFMLPLTFSIDSGYILTVSTWIFIASLYIIADYQYNFKKYQDNENIDCE